VSNQKTNSAAHILVPPGTSNTKSLNTSKISNQDFIDSIFNKSQEGISALICAKPGNPEKGGWKAHPASEVSKRCLDSTNNFFNCSTFQVSEDGNVNAKKENFSACHALVLDDVGTKIAAEPLVNFDFSWKFETSPGNYQCGLIFDEPVTDGNKVTSILDAFIKKGWCDAGASGPMSRWMRLPVGINGKPKYRSDDGSPFKCQPTEWNSDIRYSPEQMIEEFGLELVKEPTRESDGNTGAQRSPVDMTGDVYFPVNVENPVISRLKDKGLYKTPLGSGKHDVTCPWVEQHTDAIDSGTAYFEPDDRYPMGGFSCMHSHRDNYHIQELLNHLDIKQDAIRRKPLIRTVAGEMHRIIDAYEMVLAQYGRHYHSGGLICTVYTDPETGNPEISPTSLQALTKELSSAAASEKYDKRSRSWERCDPPSRHCGILYDQKNYQHLRLLKGVTRQPYFRESDGELVTTPGYDAQSNLFGVFDAGLFKIPEISPETIGNVKAKLDRLFDEFEFAGESDKAAAISAIFTAVVRATLPHAPAFHVKAHVYGSGKSYLCELIAPFAGPGDSLKVSYPKTAEEATKAGLALLMKNPAVIEFDDMDSDWTPHGVINRMLSAEHITDRILGVSKTATVSTRSLILASGNNVGPLRDLLRRVVTINLDPKTAVPATKTYQHDPVALVKSRREEYVSAVLTLIMAWEQAGCSRADVEPIATYNGLWADYCRHPVIWLGYPDPATSLIEQLKHDPDAEPLLNLMKVWHDCFDSQFTTVRKAVEKSEAFGASDTSKELAEAMKEFPVVDRGTLNRSKIGWILKKNAGRIIDGYRFERGEANGRTAWRVVYEPSE
jgi:hypothetical protein